MRNYRVVFVLVALFVISVFMAYPLIRKKIQLAQDAVQLWRVLDGLETAQRNIENGGSARLWSKSPEDFFDDPEIISLCGSIRDANYEKTAQMIQSGFELNRIGKDGMTVLFFSYCEGNFVAFKQLLENGASPDIPLTRGVEEFNGQILPRAGDSVLLAACANARRNTRFYREALRFTKFPNQQDAQGRTTAHILLANYLLSTAGKSDLLPPTIASGIDLDLADNAGKTAEDFAREKEPELLPILVQARQLSDSN